MSGPGGGSAFCRLRRAGCGRLHLVVARLLFVSLKPGATRQFCFWYLDWLVCAWVRRATFGKLETFRVYERITASAFA